MRTLIRFNILKRFTKWSLVSFFLLIPSFFVSAAVLYVDPTEGVVSPNHMFAVDVRIDNQDQCLNVFDVVLNYSNEKVEAITVSRGRSILTLWVEDPVIDHEKGEIKFTGGIPGGYCGRIVGDPDLTNVLVTIVFQPLNEGVFSGEVEISFNEKSSVLLSDGRGSLSPLDFLNAVYEVGDEPTVLAEDWLGTVRGDDRPPTSFDVFLMQDETVFGGRYYIIFSTTDKGSGLSHYEVKEEDIDHPGFIHGSDREAEFVRAQSPYLLKDQTLNSRITVRAVDNAGNERLARFEPDESMRIADSKGWQVLHNATSWMTELKSWVVFLLAVLAFGGVYYLLLGIKKRRKRREDSIEKDLLREDDGV